jgi:thioesterase domain-containing protein
LERVSDIEAIGTALAQNFLKNFSNTGMEDLFTTELDLNGKQERYQVVFDQEKYQFRPDDQSMPSFALRREHDTWIPEGLDQNELCQKATNALEAYLLQQH